MLLSEIERRYRLIGSASGEVKGIAYDSRKVGPGVVFVALKGQKADGHAYLDQVAAAGAIAVVVSEEWAQAHPDGAAIPTFVAPDTREALAYLSATYWAHPSRQFALVGVTGTNGKTTTTHLIEAVLQHAGMKTGLVGTLGSRFGDESVQTGFTTPQSLELQTLFHRMKQAGVQAVTMEVSSHALDQQRVGHCEFDVGVFTNLSVDHLDYHGTLDAYAEAKVRLFQMARRGVVNADDPRAEQFARASQDPIRFSATGPADLWADEIELTASGSRWIARTSDFAVPITMRLPGLFNVSNGLAALGAALALGIPLEKAAQGLARSSGVPGRVEVVSTPDLPFTVLVDYAHTPDGLENVLSTARAFTQGRLIVVFGCGGDRDRGKRPEMGRIGSTLADLAIISTDNPRSEDPAAILAEVAAGAEGHYRVIADREEAISEAVALARPGDVVVIAGKGHETVQIFADRTVHFDDREVARQAIARKATTRC